MSDKQTKRQSDRQTDREGGRQAGRQTDTEKDIHGYNYVGREDLNDSCWNPKSKLRSVTNLSFSRAGVAIDNSEII